MPEWNTDKIVDYWLVIKRWNVEKWIKQAKNVDKMEFGWNFLRIIVLLGNFRELWFYGGIKWERLECWENKGEFYERNYNPADDRTGFSGGW